uniref:UBC core domain-containing protein n=1 Tax=Romanomermis culicivorax TaxID=13658 RepID=A0A915IFX4_ROMCU
MDNINKRLRTELLDMMANKLKIVDNFSILLNLFLAYFCNQFNEKDAKEWSLRILPTGHPFSQAAFKLNITFPPEYPFKPPNIVFAKGANYVKNMILKEMRCT